MKVTEDRPLEPKTSAVVTFMIGNGFDLGLGLRTRYGDFIPNYLKRQTTSTVIGKLKESIVREPVFWSDAELAFGKLSFSTFGKDSRSVLLECSADINEGLAEYLRSEEKRFCPPDDECKAFFSGMLFSYYEGLGEYPRMDELERLTRFHQLKVNIINFNYTETIDKMLVPSGTMALPNWGNVQVVVNQVCHVHGSLSTEYSRLFGVNEISQVKDAGLSDDLKDLLVKPTVGRRAGCRLEQKAKRMIDESDTVIVFGMSMGATDKLWWDYLLEYIQFHPEHVLCFVPYVECNHGETCLVEAGDWAQGERNRFYNAVEAQKNHYLRTTELDEKIDVIRRGPFKDPDGQLVYCDPFRLSWFGNALVCDVPEPVHPRRMC